MRVILKLSGQAPTDFISVVGFGPTLGEYESMWADRFSLRPSRQRRS